VNLSDEPAKVDLGRTQALAPWEGVIASV
jgi:hypothetical protein